MAGGSKSQDTTSTTANYDQRQVNTWDTSSYDLSNRSTNNTNITTLDGGAVSGALGLASGVVDSAAKQLDSVIGFAKQVTTSSNATVAGTVKSSYDFADNVFHGALDAVQSNDTRAMNAFDRAATIENDALAMSKDSFANAMGMVQNAYADAKGTTQAQQKIMIGVLAVAAIAVVAPRLGK
jgi:hypothetical protein